MRFRTAAFLPAVCRLAQGGAVSLPRCARRARPDAMPPSRADSCMWWFSHSACKFERSCRFPCTKRWGRPRRGGLSVGRCRCGCAGSGIGRASEPGRSWWASPSGVSAGGRGLPSSASPGQARPRAIRSPSLFSWCRTVSFANVTVTGTAVARVRLGRFSLPPFASRAYRFGERQLHTHRRERIARW